MSIFKRMMKMFSWKDTGSYVQNPGLSYTASVRKDKPNGKRAARREQWRKSWKEYQR